MPHVAALYRYPIKGFAPERRERLQVEPGGRIAGDRVLAFRHADATEPEDEDGLDRWPKGGGLCVRDYPALNRLTLDYTAEQVRLSAGGEVIAQAGLDDGGRSQLASAVTEYLLSTPDGARLARPGRLPLSVVGDGQTATFTDRARGFVSVHSRTSLAALAEAVGTELDERRFRSNIALDGWDAWAEDELIGRQVRIGTVTFDVVEPIVRCLAVHANPETGLRDAPVMTTLTRTVGKKKPSFGILLLPVGGGGSIGVGDEVAIVP
ncbi:MOSC domain-containing protein [Ruania zhangjianzhongii]|uniref:MOSC domain-containing protein n=1 Tax=Ruania zhangjianzhongii TaxID=2603206 RepID=UPI0011C71FFC|nr:MOSC N-terminal beta barrel domain-containing protein [Ruania zhangjianzhongii]